MVSLNIIMDSDLFRPKRPKNVVHVSKLELESQLFHFGLNSCTFWVILANFDC